MALFHGTFVARPVCSLFALLSLIGNAVPHDIAMGDAVFLMRQFLDTWVKCSLPGWFS